MIFWPWNHPFWHFWGGGVGTTTSPLSLGRQVSPTPVVPSARCVWSQSISESPESEVQSQRIRRRKMTTWRFQRASSLKLATSWDPWKSMVGFRCAFFFWGAKGRFSRVFALSFRECNTKDWEMQLVRNGDLCWPLLIGIFDGKCTEVLHHLGYFRWKEWDIYGYLTYQYKIYDPTVPPKQSLVFQLQLQLHQLPKLDGETVGRLSRIER